LLSCSVVADSCMNNLTAVAVLQYGGRQFCE